MTWSVSETLDRVRARLPRSLKAGALERCTRIAERIPDAASSHYLEFRLNSSPEIDFLTCSAEKRIAAEFDQRLTRNRSAAWQKNVATLREWASDYAALSAAPFIFLEYDAADPFNEEEPEASLSIGVERNYRRRHWARLCRNDTNAVALGKLAFRRLLPEAQREACMAVLERCYAALPPSAAIPHAPVMTVRQPVTAKPYVILPRGSEFEFLEKIGWPGSMEALRALLETYYASFQRSIYLDLTITDRVEERLGIVTSQFQSLETDVSSLEWWRLPKALCHYKEELRDWVGQTEEKLGGQRVWIHRWVDTKAVLKGAEIEYKAYLGFSPMRPPLFC